MAPGEVADEAVPEFPTAAGLSLLATGTPPLTTTEYTPEDTRVELPSAWYVAGRAAWQGGRRGRGPSSRSVIGLAR